VGTINRRVVNLGESEKKKRIGVLNLLNRWYPTAKKPAKARTCAVIDSHGVDEDKKKLRMGRKGNSFFRIGKLRSTGAVNSIVNTACEEDVLPIWPGTT